MKLTRYIKIPLFLFIITAVFAFVSENYILSGGIKQFDINRFTKTLHKKEQKIDDLMQKAIKAVELGETSENLYFFSKFEQYHNLLDDHELTMLITKNNELIYWSDHISSFADAIFDAEKGLIHLLNGWYILNRKELNEYTVYGLTLIKYDYKIQNDFLKNNFARGFHLPSEYEIHFYPSEQSFPVYNKQNQFLFSINPTGSLPCIYSDLYIPAVLYIIAFFMLFMFLYRVSNHYFQKHKRTKLLLLLIFLVALYMLMCNLQLPSSLYMLKLFSPKYFAYTFAWNSIGELLVFSLFIFFWSLVFFRLFDLPEKIKSNKTYTMLALISGLTFIALLFVLLREMMQILVMNSAVSFAVYRIGEINLYSFPGFLSLGLLYFGFFFIAFRFVQAFRKTIPARVYLLVLSVITIFIASILFFMNNTGQYKLNLFFWPIMAASFYIIRNKYFNHRLSIIVLFSLIFTLFTLNTLVSFIEKHENNIQELTAINLSAEHDPTAEIFLRDIDAQIKNDPFIDSLLIPPYDDAAEYIGRKYFGGYLREYELQQTFCHDNDSLLIHPDNTLQPCNNFFSALIEEHGAPIPETNFYFFDNLNGRITYFGVYNYMVGESETEINLFIELNSKLLSEGAGFPELLLPSQSSENRLRNNFSFAKYNNNELVDRGGSFLYALTPETYKIRDNNIGFFKNNGHIHCAYTIGKNNYIIVSRKHIVVFDYLIAFPYIFVFLFIMSIVSNFINRPYLGMIKIKGSLRLRVQASIIGVVFIALLIIGSGTIYFIINQYRENHRDDLIDKINSVSVELDMMMYDVEQIDNYTSEFLNFELINISEIFWTDINIYSLEGDLIATSRPEVFEKGLISTKMDNTAYKYLTSNKPTRYLHRENIAKMEYLSAYVPLVNYTGKNIAFLNIPYFTKEREFRKQITTFIVAFINIYVFLLLASILVAYYISARITDPLRLIRENLQEVQLGKSTKPIEYKTDDEIGLLVTEYNNKVKELALRAEQLARSERETAWREMAKQIAHEIKNPLTPMKLNIQFLQRTGLQNPQDYKEKVLKVTGTLIEQIDNLSAIATEFSNFAKIPRAKNQVFNLIERLNETLKLYNYTGQVDVKTNYNKLKKVEIMADPEQFSRAIINLIKNAIQSIPEEKTGKINIELKKDNDWALISIEDNGKGIPENLKESIFVPNFTTKTSGAGLGLAITRNIVENFKGKIGFESETNKGSTFYIKIPLYK
jgi:signal transduction histidine kinase